jgi:sugar/nucleoside kinase (ribokinase family)
MQNMPFNIIGIGAPLCDHIMHVSEEYLSQLHARKGEMIVIDHESLQHILRTAPTQPIMLPGGSAANVMQGLAHLGHACAVIGSIGNDPCGEYLVKSLQALNIATLYSYVDMPTGQVVCLVTPDGERTFRAYLGAAHQIDYHKIDPHIFQKASLVHIEGYALQHYNLVPWAMQHIKQVGGLLSFDLANFEILNTYKDKIFELLRNYVDIVFANTSEAEALLGLPPKEACAKLSEYCHVAVVTMNVHGCWIAHKGSMTYAPAFPSIAIDSTGAGDLFACGFLHGYLAGRPLGICAHMGALIASEVVKVHGATLPASTWDVLRQQISAL